MKRLSVQTPAMASKALLVVGVSATVLSIGDGDTLRVRQSGRAVTLRLACIDAPEIAQSPSASRPAATCSSGSLSAARSGSRSRPPIATAVRLPR